jgi:hypothetical protein
LQDTDEGLPASFSYEWDKMFEVPLLSRRVVWIAMYTEFFCGSGRNMSRVSVYEDDAMFVAMFINSTWYKANKACIIGWFGNTQHEWVVAEPSTRGTLNKIEIGINVFGPIDIFKPFRVVY